MPQITNLNVAPYYDDFDKDDNFHRVLFRPGYAVQARELTTLQSIMQNQVERFGRHMFQEGTVVIPGQASLSVNIDNIQLASTFGGETIVPSQYYNATNPVVITGATSGVKAKVIGYQDATSTTQPILILQYLNTGSDYVTRTFSDSENITADIAITHTTAYAAQIASATTHSTDAAQIGSSAKVEEGVYFIRGQFVRCAEQVLVLSTTSAEPSKRIGFTITEELTTPELDSSLTDNATGSANYAAKGAHRLKITLTLSAKEVGSTDDTDFVELMEVKRGVTQANKSELTKYAAIGDTLARRTHDESGDYTTVPFQFDIREGIDNSVKTKEYDGVYTSGTTTDDGSDADESLLAIACYPGKAYVRGYEIEKHGLTFKDLGKARDFDTINAGVTNLDFGNFVRITNVYGTPDIGEISGETTAYKTLKFFNNKTATRGSSSGMGANIGVARPRGLEYNSGVAGDAAAEHKLYLFDIQMFTRVELSDTPSPLLTATHTTGVRLKGNTSGATGFLFSTESGDDGTSASIVNLVNVTGKFQVGEKIIASDSAETSGLIENSDNTDLTISSLENFTFDEVRAMFMDDDDAGQDFTADVSDVFIKTDSLMHISGTDSDSSDASGGIVLEDETEGFRIGLETLREPRLKEPEKNSLIFRLPKQVIKTLKTEDNDNVSDSQIYIRRQFVGTTNASGAVSFTAGTNETFVSFVAADYALSILTAGDGTGSQGDLVDISSTISGTGGATVTITDSTILGNGAKVKFIGTVLKTAVNSRIKTTNLLKQVKVVASDADGAYGVRANDKEISLGRTDVYRLQAVYDSEDTSADASAPSMTISSVSGTFSRGEKIVGATSKAKGRVLTTTSPMSYTLNGNFGVQDFTAGETITGQSSGATATVGTLTAGSKIITSNFELDTGQRDNFYDIARIVRKPNVAAPRGRLLVIFDYFSHGAGEYFSVDSYTASAGQMNYDDIPTYTATRVDPDDPEPTGQFDLRDCLDFRPTCEDIAGSSTTVTAVDTITGNSFDFSARQYDGTGAVVVNIPKPNSASTHDYEFFLGKMAEIYLTTDGMFKILEGASAEQPKPPRTLENAMHLASMILPPYTFRPTDVKIKRMKTQRYTMRDIGRLKDRIENIESVTALSLLERDAESFEIQDANGLNRFKSGFIVDNFAGHRVGDTLHKDYQCAIDMQKNHLRPKCVMRNAALTEVSTTDALRTAAGYQKTGDLITLPYSEESFVNQPFATRVENVQTYLIHEWVGKITMDPAGDEWFETDWLPAVTIQVEGNFDTLENGLKNKGELGTVWNAWETQWSGHHSTEKEEFVSGFGNQQNEISVRTTQTTRTDLTRTGVNKEVVEKIDEESLGARIVSRAVIPFIRPRSITITGQCFRPGIRLYAYFDGKDISSLITPSSSTYSNVDSPVEGSALVTDGAGKVECTFRIPEYRFSGQESQPKFKTGDVEFRLTSDSNNKASGIPLSAGHTIYRAKGILEVKEETILATRNGEIVQTNVNDKTSNYSKTSYTSIIQNAINKQERDERSGRQGTIIQQNRDLRGNVVDSPKVCFFNDGDPLAQTFLVSESGGCFLTKLDLYFSAKDNTLPVWVEVRNVVNGYPGPKLLPFGRKVLNSSEVNVDADTGTSATTFTFDSPVYLQEGIEYCFVTMTNSLDYKIWISQMGETDVSGSNRIISGQAHLGSLFKSQNNRTWDAVQSQDKKFTLYKAQFDSPTFETKSDDAIVATGGVSTVSLSNDNIGTAVTKEEGDSTVYVQKLLANPIVITNGDTTIKVRHRDHGMYSTSNNVTITGVSSGISTTLDGAITATGTSLTLTSSTNFPSSGTAFVKVNNEIISGTISGTTISSLTRGIGDSDGAAHSDDDTVELYMINSVPLTEINKTHTSLANIEMDSYTFECSTTPSVTGTSGLAEVGGTSAYASENYRFEVMKTMLSTLELGGTLINSKVRSTTATSPSGTETSFTTDTAAKAKPFALDENFQFETSRMVCSAINETNELSGEKSFFINLDMSTTNPNVSPVIDLGRSSVILVANRLDNIDSSSSVFPTTDYNASTEPDGDQNSAIYLTKSIALENPATSIKVFFAAAKKSTSEIKVLFKTLGSDQAKASDELGYTFFNTDGSPDSTVRTSLSDRDFQEYVYTAGVTDDGIGEPLPEFSQFQIKIVMQGTDAANPPLIKDLRIIALAT